MMWSATLYMQDTSSKAIMIAISDAMESDQRKCVYSNAKKVKPKKQKHYLEVHHALTTSFKSTTSPNLKPMVTRSAGVMYANA